jgi:hypothetical protein
VLQACFDLRKLTFVSPVQKISFVPQSEQQVCRMLCDAAKTSLLQAQERNQSLIAFAWQALN